MKQILFIHQSLNHSEFLAQNILKSVLVGFPDQSKTDLDSLMVHAFYILQSLNHKPITVLLIIQSLHYFLECLLGKHIVDEIDVNELIIGLKHQLIR